MRSMSGHSCPTSYIWLGTVEASINGRTNWTGVRSRRVLSGIRLWGRRSLRTWVALRAERLVGGGVAFRIRCATRLPTANTAARIRGARSARRNAHPDCQRWDSVRRPDYRGRKRCTAVLRDRRWSRDDDDLRRHNRRGRNRAVLRRSGYWRRIRQVGGLHANRCCHGDCDCPA